MSLPVSPSDPNPHSDPYLDMVDVLRSAGCVFAEEEAALLIEAASSPVELEAMLVRRVEGEPVEHVVGWVRFCGRSIALDPGVFVPRVRTEFLVECTAALRPSTLLDLCCGSGAVGLSVDGVSELHAVDIEPAAVACARRNLAAVGGVVHEGDLYDALPAVLHHRFDAIAVNAPYVPTADIAFMPREARVHEPLVALDGGGDGVDVHRRVAESAAHWLVPGGHLLIETSERQSASTLGAVVDAGFDGRVAVSDAVGAVVVVGSIPDAVS